MFIQRFTTRLPSSRTSDRPIAAARRVWMVQRLEARCVMAADLQLSNPWPTADLATPEVPAWLASYNTSNSNSGDPSSSNASLHQTVIEAYSLPSQPGQDFFNAVAVDQVVTDRVAKDQVFTLNLTGRSTFDVSVRAADTMIFRLDPEQLSPLFGNNEVVGLQVVYDSLRWQLNTNPSDTSQSLVPATESPGTATTQYLDAAPEQLNTAAEQLNTAAQLNTEVQQPEPASNAAQVDTGNQDSGAFRFESLVDQTASIQVDVQFANAAAGSVSQIFLTIGTEAPSQATLVRHEQLRRVALDHLGFDPGNTSNHPLNNSVIDGQDRGTTESNPGGRGDAVIDAPGSNWVGEEPRGPVPTSDTAASSPLPESRRETVDRQPRSLRRTLDIRSSNISPSTRASNNRTAVSPESLATQTTVANVYQESMQPATEPTRWVIDPKPARLLSATFLLSRTSRDDATVAGQFDKPENQASADEEPESNAHPLPSLAINTITARSAISPVNSQSTRATQVAVEGKLVITQSAMIKPATVTSTQEVTQTESISSARTDVKDHADDSPDAEPSLYASVVDRVLGSPISLTALLGLTLVARFNDPDEQHGIGV